MRNIHDDRLMVRIRAYSWALSMPIILALASIVWFWIATDSRALLGFGIAVALQIFLSLVIACPQCGKSPYAIGAHWGPLAMGGKPVPDAICSKCGYDFRKSGRESEVP